LFAKAAVRDLNHDLALPGAQRLEAFPEVGLVSVLLGSPQWVCTWGS
jgi:hypothetical protein